MDKIVLIRKIFGSEFDFTLSQGSTFDRADETEILFYSQSDKTLRFSWLSQRKPNQYKPGVENVLDMI